MFTDANKTYIFDIETNGLLDKVSKIHCTVIYCLGTKKFYKLVKYSDMVKFFSQKDITIIGHNIIRYDLPVIKRILNINYAGNIVDTLGVSWYLEPKQKEHGLEYYGTLFKIPKPKIDDWVNGTVKEYLFRCTRDVKINTILYVKQFNELQKLYSDRGCYKSLVNYLNFKLDCAREQEEIGWKLDVERCTKGLEELELVAEERLQRLKDTMPKVPKYKLKNIPKILFKKNGELTESGKKWMDLLIENNLPKDNKFPVKIFSHNEDPNPKSVPQLKDWLFSLGWNPCTFKYEKDDIGNLREIPQVSSNGSLTRSVEILIDKNPQLEVLQGLTVINHRISILKGFLKDVDSKGYIRACVDGFTNTLRFKHRVLVNLPSVNKPYGELIRGCLIAPSEDHILCGSDMSSLEDNTKQHYIYFYDPEYVKAMRVPGFDPHLDIAVQGGMLTEEQVQAHKEGKEDHSKVRKDAKQVNFSAVYGVGPPKLSLTTGWPTEKAAEMLRVYWKRNWAVKRIAENSTYKIVGRKMWLWNPVSKFWYSLRFEKDIFSTLNQGTGVFAFDTQVKNVRAKGIKICGQFHDR